MISVCLNRGRHNWGERQTKELRLVRGRRQVKTIRRVFPYDVIFGVLMELEVMNEHPKSKKFTDVLASDNGVSTDLQHPSIPLESVPHLAVLSP